MLIVALAVTAGIAAAMYAGRHKIRHMPAALFAAGALAGHAAPAASAGPVPPMTLGMNLGTPTYYSAEWAFADPIKNNADFRFGDQFSYPGMLTPGGWLHNVPRGNRFKLPIQFSTTWRAGTYDCRVSPGWSITLEFYEYYASRGGSLRQQGERFQLTIPKSTPGYSIQLVFVAERDNASLDLLACQPHGQPPAFLNADFVKDMKPFGVIRFMTWMNTNNSALVHWADRPLPTDMSIVPRSASVEDMVKVANELGADPWFTLPFHADADYVRQFATYVRDHLDAGRKAYVELSNEVWNPGFQQSKDALAAGKARYPGVSDQQATDFYYADRVRETMAIWKEVFGGKTDRLVRVAAAQHAWTQRAGDILAHADTWKSVDALATAPYFGTMIQDITEAGKPRVDKVLARLPAQADETVRFGVENKAQADKYGLRYITYEGGPDVIGFTPEAHVDVDAIIHDPRMHDIYLAFLRKWQQRVGGLLVLFDDAGASSYSHSDYTGQPLADTPKMRALVDFAATLPAAR